MYEGLARIGFRGGRILEPGMGTGNFFGAMPPDVRAASRLSGVELDDITGRIAQKLYDGADVRVQGYQDAKFPDNFFDLAISNVPFANVVPFDKRYRTLRFSLHNYYFAKSLDKVRPGGIVAFITSRFTMDALDPRVRNYIADRADLLGAIRLPDTAFKATAGTEVTTDIIFLQKRDPDIRATDRAWTDTGKIQDPFGKGEIDINRYFIKNPKMMLGKMTLQGKMHAKDTPTLSSDRRDLADALKEAVARLPENVYAEAKTKEEAGESQAIVLAPDTVKDRAFTDHEGKLSVRDGDILVPVVGLKGDQEARIRGMMELRDQARNVLFLQVEGVADEELVRQQKILEKEYRKFERAFGPLNEKVNRKLFEDDPDASLILSLEHWDEDENKVRGLADIFTKRTIPPRVRILTADNAKDALIASLSERGRVDMDYILKLTSRTVEQVQKELGKELFHNPDGGWETASQYLSGNVREKLALAEAAARITPEYERNVEALKEVIPEDLPADKVSVRLGSPWLRPQDIEAFVKHLIGVDTKVNFIEQNASWVINDPRARYNRETATETTTWGTPTYPALDLILDTMNLKQVRVVKPDPTDPDRKRTITDQVETQAAQAKQAAIKREFGDWIWADADRQKALLRIYNDTYNNLRAQEYDGSHLTLPGKSIHITMYPHQLDAVWRIVQDGNALLAHVVGSGKTFTIVSAAMELRRMGLAKKPIITVLKSTLPQWQRAFMELYPTANIIVADAESFSPANRRKFFSKIATGDYDAVLMSHQQFGMIPMSADAQAAYFQEQIADIEAAIREHKAAEGEARGKKKDPTTKELEKALARWQARLKKLGDLKKEDLVTFEEMGFDFIFVDESHKFKNLFFFTKMGNVPSLGQTEGSMKAFDLFMKGQHIQKMNKGRGMVFATGTPITNSMAEMYTIQRYLQYPILEAGGIRHFDNWANTFGEMVEAMEMHSTGQGYQSKSRFARFTNLPELISAFRQVADIKQIDDLPKVKAALPQSVHFSVIESKPTEWLKSYVAHLKLLSDSIKGKKPEKGDPNHLTIVNDGKKAALDPRLIDPSLPEFVGARSRL